ncbi:EndoU domain-containing protein [Spirillospora sp. NPDC047279]|uniref:EndoU domain-containing protein n=1 Tax=Spirillospora sp. NPDC047279 TaxID=3155478 RepID=UPI0034063F64
MASLVYRIVKILTVTLLVRRGGGGGGAGAAGAGLFEPAVRWMKKKIAKSGRHHHVFRGEVRKGGGGNWTAGGYHHRFMGQDWPDRRIGPVTATGPNGTYRARVQMLGPGNQWVDKPYPSTFFPDNWTPQQVDRSIRGAFDNRVDVQGSAGPDGLARRWRGVGEDGMLIEGSYKRSSRNWDSAWPVV